MVPLSTDEAAMAFTPDQALITREEVRRRLGVGNRTLDRMIAAGHFPRGMGKPPRWYVADCDTYLWLRGRGGLPRENLEEKKKNSPTS